MTTKEIVISLIVFFITIFLVGLFPRVNYDCQYASHNTERYVPASHKRVTEQYSVYNPYNYTSDRGVSWYVIDLFVSN